jgi:hypothetical protein
MAYIFIVTHFEEKVNCFLQESEGKRPKKAIPKGSSNVEIPLGMRW